MSQTITEFLEARITEDEQAEARKFRARDDLLYAYQIDSEGWVELETRNGMKHERLSAQEFWAKYGEPAPDQRVLAECAAKRAILEDRARIDRSANDDEWSMGWSDANYSALRSLAAVYADHPDYQQEWAA